MHNTSIHPFIHSFFLSFIYCECLKMSVWFEDSVVSIWYWCMSHTVCTRLMAVSRQQLQHTCRAQASTILQPMVCCSKGTTVQLVSTDSFRNTSKGHVCMQSRCLAAISTVLWYSEDQSVMYILTNTHSHPGCDCFPSQCHSIVAG
jgi:hypothetical protein